MTPNLFASRVLAFGRSRCVVLSFLLVVCAATSTRSLADEGGLPFWLSGQFGSLAAAPQVPGWNVGVIYYHSFVAGSGSVAAARQITIGRLSPAVNVNLNLNLRGQGDLVAVAPGYVFADKVVGGQLAATLTAIGGRNAADLNGILTLSSGPFAVTRQGSISNSLTSFGDLYPEISLRWNSGVHNWMVYGEGDIPVANYNPANLANLGIGHGAADAGSGYTYLDPKTGHEFSIVTGLTYNLLNPSTGYQNGVDWHVDWGASQFVTKQLQLGAVGYFYQQITPDQGASPILGAFEARVAAVGPQVGYIFPLGKMQGYLNLKAYWEFAAQNRADGWNAWLTFALSPAEPEAPSRSPMVTK